MVSLLIMWVELTSDLSTVPCPQPISPDPTLQNFLRPSWKSELLLDCKKEPKQAETKAHSPVTQSQPRHRQVVGIPSCSCRLSALSSVSYLCCWGASALALCQLVRQHSRAQQEKVTTASTPPQPRAHPALSPLAFLWGLPWPSVALEK